MTPNRIIELNWYKDYNIQVIESIRNGEAYCTVGDFEIDADYGTGKYNIPGKDYQVIQHLTFAFFPYLWLGEKPEKRIIDLLVSNIEKVYLLQKLGVRKLPSVEEIIKPEGAEISVVDRKLIESVANLDLDELLKKETKDKEIYFFQRVKWTDTDKGIRARFNFLVLNGDAT